ncbi:MAG TPA: hypothetical protein VNU97_08175 [Rhizomicrobium sp.]|jgi:HPr kinase/phosphorylase|nr:hypothetical protein [Rhizomicrobium sp.]
MAHRVNIHATCVRLGRAGVLLLGRSGAGKSDLALRLIGRGAVLVSDDRCDLSVVRGALVAQAPKTIAGLLEVRGLGIVAVPHLRSARIALVVDLSARAERLPEHRTYAPPSPLAPATRPTLISLNAFEASAPDKVIAALRHRGARAPVKRN